jgi:hypothetical protein
MAQSRGRVMLATVLLSHAGDGTIEATSAQRDVDAELCWQQCSEVILVTALPR